MKFANLGLSATKARQFWRAFLKLAQVSFCVGDRHRKSASHAFWWRGSGHFHRTCAMTKMLPDFSASRSPLLFPRFFLSLEYNPVILNHEKALVDRPFSPRRADPRFLRPQKSERPCQPRRISIHKPREYATGQRFPA